MGFERSGRSFCIECNLAAGEGFWVKPPKQQIGVGDRWVLAPPAIAGGSGFCPGAARPHGDAPERVHFCDRSAAGANLDHLHHRNFHRHAAAFHEAVRAVDLEHARQQGLAIVEQANFRGGAAHVE